MGCGSSVRGSRGTARYSELQEASAIEVSAASQPEGRRGGAEDLVDFVNASMEAPLDAAAFVDLVVPLVQPQVGPWLAEEDILRSLVRAIFADIDEDCSGVISCEAVLWFVVGHQPQGAGPDTLTVRHFLELMARLVLEKAPPRATAPPGVALAILDLFYGTDVNQDGTVDELEFQFVVNGLGIDVSPGAVAFVFREIDADANGLVDITEFHSWLQARAALRSAGGAHGIAEAGWTLEAIQNIIRAVLLQKDVEVKCCICLCEDPLHTMFAYHPEASTCQAFAHGECLRAGIRAEGFARCPECRDIADIVQLKRLLSPEEQDRYFERTLAEYEVTHRNLVFHCPTPNCRNFTQLPHPVEEKDRDRFQRSNLWQCCLCGQNWCAACSKPFYGLHNKRSCNQTEEILAARHRRAEELNQKDNVLLLTCKCGVEILKVGGCKFVACQNRKCNLSWCWVCRAGPSRERHFGHSCLIGAYFGRHTAIKRYFGEEEEEHPIDTIEEIVEEIVKYQRRDLNKSVKDVTRLISKFIADRGINSEALRQHFLRAADREVLECLPDVDLT